MSSMRDDDAEAVRRAVKEGLAVLEAMSWDDLDQHETRIDTLIAPSGRRFRIRTWAYWDMEPWESDMWLVAEAQPEGGFFRWRWPVKERELRRGETLPPRPQ